MSSLSEANVAKIKSVYQREFKDLPLAKDLPRLAKYISICDEEGVRLSYQESQRLDIEQQTAEKGSEFSIFYQVRRVLLTLCLALEGAAKCLEVDDALLQLLEEHDFLLPEVLNPFLEKHLGGDTGKVVRVLKCVNQAAIAPSLIELKMALGVENTTKDVAGTWCIFIVLSHDSLRVTHTKKEVCIQNRFQLEWKLRFSLAYNQMDQLRGLSFEIIDLKFNPETNSKKIAEIRTLAKPYLQAKLATQITNKPQLMRQEIPLKEVETLEHFSLRYPGEVFYLKLDKVLFVHHQLAEKSVSEGILILSNFALYFYSAKDVFFTPLSNVTRIVRKKEKGDIEIISKDMRQSRLIFSGKDLKIFLEAWANIVPTTFRELFAEAYSKALVRQLTAVESSSYALLHNGWRSYDLEKEFERMEMNMTEWRLSDLNARFQLCETYPRIIVVPSGVSDAELLMSCRYRKDGRVPVLTWIHRNQSTLCHASCPAVDYDKSSLGREDDKVIAAIISSSMRPSEGDDPAQYGHSSFSFTGRRYSADTGNHSKSKAKKLLKPFHLKRDKARTGSVVDTSEFYHYFFVDLLHKSDSPKPRDFTESFPDLAAQVALGQDTIFVDNLSDLRDSYRKLQKLCAGSFNLTSDEHWLNALDNTRWLDQIRTLMQSANRVVELMEFGTSVLLTCPAGGWDRGCQVSSLAQLWMDPFYRTTRGFMVLVEKEWLSFGHPFGERSSLLSKDDSAEVIPVFVQWLDATWQTLQQFPNYFEFTNSLLVEIAEASFSGVFGTFLFDNEQTRRSNLIRMNTESFWTHVIDNFQYRNPFYMPSPDATLVPSFNPRALSFWTSFYLRWYEGPFSSKLPREGLSPTGSDALALTNVRDLSIKQELERHILSLETALTFVRQEIEAKHEVLDLVRRGSLLSTAIQQVLLTSRDKSITDIMGAETPPSPVVLRRKSRVMKIRGSHHAITERIGTRRASLPDSENTISPAKPKNQRQSRSVYLKKEDVDLMLENFDPAPIDRRNLSKNSFLDLPAPFPDLPDLEAKKEPEVGNNDQ